jgi:hypothetical protein
MAQILDWQVNSYILSPVKFQYPNITLFLYIKYIKLRTWSGNLNDPCL